MESKLKKLELNQETVRNLTTEELRSVAGGLGMTAISHCISQCTGPCPATPACV
jgi:natural product precursor